MFSSFFLFQKTNESLLIKIIRCLLKNVKLGFFLSFVLVKKLKKGVSIMKKTENFDFFDVNKTYRELFFQYPQVFIYGDTYKEMSNDAKTAYMIFKNRLQYSIKNNWIDENNKIYFIFTNKELESILNVSKNTVTKIKKELEDFGLLLQVPQGFNHKKKRNNPHRLYLSNLDVTAKDVYLFKETAESLDTSGIPKNGTRNKKEKNAESLDTSGIPKNGTRGKMHKPLAMSGIPKNDLYIYKELSTKDIKDIKEISKTDKTHLELISNSFKESDTATETMLIESYIEEQNYENLYGTDLIREIKKMSRSDFDTFIAYMNKLEFAQKSVEEEEDISIPIYDNNQYADFTSDQLISTFKRCMYQFRFGKVENIESYLFISFKAVFKDLALAIKQSNQ